MYLENIKEPSDIKRLSIDELKVLAREIRQVILDTVIENGGHLASSLGAVEIILAMHYVFDSPHDKMIFDVGHQCYAHKLLTGRLDEFSTLRKKDGLAGFPKRNESVHDIANTGHSSTSVSLACGLSRSLLADNDSSTVISLIGDGALTGGLAYEALNDATTIPKKQITILNDNSMSISNNVGSTANYLLKLHNSNMYRRFKKKAYTVVKGFSVENIPRTMMMLYKLKNSVKYFLQGGMPFEQFGQRYFGPIDGHNLEQLINALTVAKNDDEDCLIHVVTKKGYGYREAENNPAKYHGYSPVKSSGVSFSQGFGESMCALGETDSKVYAVTAAMCDGTGLNKYAEKFPRRFADVGIAEAHATTMCAGLALGGYKPYFAVYSSFLQRAYDSLIHDVCLQDLPVTFCIDRAGLVPDDGETHQGIYDVGFMRLIPNMAVACPKDNAELDAMLKWSLEYEHPLAIRYPKGVVEGVGALREVSLGKWDIIEEWDSRLIILASGARMVSVATKLLPILRSHGLVATLVNARFVKPLDTEYLDGLDGKMIVTLEDNILAGGFGSAVLEYINANDIDAKVINYGIDDSVLTHATVDELLVMTGLDADSLADKIEGRFAEFIAK